MGATRSIGLNQFNDDLANAAVPQLPIISINTGIDFNVQILNFGLGVEWQSFSYNSNALNIVELVNGNRTEVNVSGNDFGVSLSYDFLGKNDDYRLEPFVGFAQKTTRFYMQYSDTTYTNGQILSGAQNAYRESEKLGFVLYPGLRFLTLSEKYNFSFDVSYRWMASRYNWSSPDLSITQLSGISVNIGLVINLQKLFRNLDQ